MEGVGCPGCGSLFTSLSAVGGAQGLTAVVDEEDDDGEERFRCPNCGTLIRPFDPELRAGSRDSDSMGLDELQVDA